MLDAMENLFGKVEYTRLGPFGQLLLLIVSVVCIFLWLSRRKKTTTLPVWAIIEIAIASHSCSKRGFAYKLYSRARRFNGSLFGLTSKHQVLINFSGVDRLMSHSFHTVNAEPMQYTIFTRAFGGIDSIQMKTKLKLSWKELLKPVEELFLNDTAATAALERGGIANEANHFVSFSDKSGSLQRWELSAKPKLLSNDAVEVNLQSITRDFGACIAIPLLYGRDFFERYPGILDDFWRFDNDAFPLLMIGLPTWLPSSMMRNGIASRSQLLNAMTALYRRIDQYQRGEVVDSDADMSDISTTALERNEVYDRRGWTYEERGAGDLAVLWGQNANTHPNLFWLMLYIHSTPGLVSSLREEVAPYVNLLRPRVSGQQPQIESIDFPGLFAHSILLKACLYETFRMANEATSIRYITAPMTLTDGDYKHHIKAGTWVSAPHAINQRNPNIYLNPDTFNPTRFLHTDPDTGKQSVRYGKLKPWGSGAAMCKGRSFAEKEIMACTAAIITLWDVAPAHGGEWEIPDMMPGTGVRKPMKDVRVVVTRRRMG